MKKIYNFSDDLFFKKGAKDNNLGSYKRRYRIINLNEKKFLERKSSLGLLIFVLLHEIGHLRQHEKLGLLRLEEKSILEKKYLEEDADKFAMSYFCKKCRQELKEEIINMHYSWVAIEQNSVDKNLRNAYIALGFQSEQDCKEKISQIAKNGLRRVALKLCNKSNKKFEKLFEDMKNKKIISEARSSNMYLSKEEFLKELDSVETEECLCCKFIGQENLHTVPTEL